MIKSQSTLEADGFLISQFNESRAFSSFLPGIAGEFGKPLWVFYTNRGQCVSSFGIGNRNSAMLEFHAANKAYTLTPLYGFRTFIKFLGADGIALYEPFQPCAEAGVEQQLCIRPEEIEIVETHRRLGLQIKVVYFTLPHENVPALVRRVTVENIGDETLAMDVLDGLPQIVPFGLEEKLLKSMSRTMEAFSEILHIEESLPFYKLKVEPSDKPEMERIHGGFFTFTLSQGRHAPVIADPDQVFGTDTSMRTPLAFLQGAALDPLQGRCETMTGSAFAHLLHTVAPGGTCGWDSYFGQAPDWKTAWALRERIASNAQYAPMRRGENTKLIADIGNQFALLAAPKELDAYSRQAFLDNTLRGGQPVVIQGPRGPRIFHTFTRKHGDMERDYNAFEVAPTYWSQGNGNFRDVNQNRRSENFIFPDIDATNIETFFNLIQLDGNNPLVIQAEKFCVPPDQLPLLWQTWHAGETPAWHALLTQPFSPGELLEALVKQYGTPDMARPWFECILGLADKIQDASHGEGYWVDHWIYNLDLIDSYSALYPDRMQHLLVERSDFSYFDNDHIVQPRHLKYVLRKDGTVRQLHAVVKDSEKSNLIGMRSSEPHKMRSQAGHGSIYQTTLLAKILNLMAVKASLLDPFGRGLEMEAEKPGWCDALNGLPGLVGSSSHEAYALQRWSQFVRRVINQGHVPPQGVKFAGEVAAFLGAVTASLARADPQHFLPTWQQLTGLREAFRVDTRLGVAGSETLVSTLDITRFLDATDLILNAGLSQSVDASGLPISYFINEITAFNVLPSAALTAHDEDEPAAIHVEALQFQQKPVSSFLEGAMHALRSTRNTSDAGDLHDAVRKSSLFDSKLGMYRVNTPLDSESFEIGRSKIFSPGWLENESIFLHMHYKFLLETLRSGLASEFFQDFKQGLIAFQKPEVYGRSPLENSSFIASSRFPDAKVHGVGFVARLSGATAEWISMVLHMGLGAAPFQVVDGALRFAPAPVLADWLFTQQPTGGFEANSFAFKLFGHTWVVYSNPSRKHTYGTEAVTPIAFELRYPDGQQVKHSGAWLPEALALDLRQGHLVSMMITLA